MKLKAIQQKFSECLNVHYGNDEIDELFWMCAEEVLNFSRLQIKLKRVDDLSLEEEFKFNRILDELIAGKPIQYILGYAWFFNQKFTVNESVLIPRPETEELVALILDENKEENLRVLDIGTGSGCIPISLKIHLPIGSEVFGVDISDGALKVANNNASKLSYTVNFQKVDILEKEPSIVKGDEKFNIIVSNPPYITPKEKLAMHKNVLDFEPHLALFVEEKDPLIFYNAIADYAKKNLVSDGKLYFEINQAYGTAIVDMLERKGFHQVKLKKDLSGLDRMVKATL